MTETALTVARLWKNMTLEQRMAAALAFWQDEEATNDQLQAVMFIAQQKKFRPKTVIGLDVDRKARIFADRRRAQTTRRAPALAWLSASRAVGVTNCA